MKKSIIVSLAFVALVAFADSGIAQQKDREKKAPTPLAAAQPISVEKNVDKAPPTKACSKAKTVLEERLSAIEACEKIEKQGRAREAQKCRVALKNVPIPFKFDKTLRTTPDSACPAIGSDRTAGKAKCWSGTSSGGCSWGVCNVGVWWCWADCGGSGCVAIND